MNEAVVSPCGQFRYMLRRGDAPRLAFVLLNPLYVPYSQPLQPWPL